MAYCPTPGPPCYTEKSTESANLNLLATAKHKSEISTEIAWQRKYFDNPIVSSVPITVKIYDVNKSKTLVEFVEIENNELAKLGCIHYYVPQGLDKLKGHEIVTYQFIEDSKDQYEFKIQVL